MVVKIRTDQEIVAKCLECGWTERLDGTYLPSEPKAVGPGDEQLLHLHAKRHAELEHHKVWVNSRTKRSYNGRVQLKHESGHEAVLPEPPSESTAAPPVDDQPPEAPEIPEISPDAPEPINEGLEDMETEARRDVDYEEYGPGEPDEVEDLPEVEAEVDAEQDAPGTQDYTDPVTLDDVGKGPARIFEDEQAAKIHFAKGIFQRRPKLSQCNVCKRHSTSKAEHKEGAIFGGHRFENKEYGTIGCICIYCKQLSDDQLLERITQ